MGALPQIPTPKKIGNRPKSGTVPAVSVSDRKQLRHFVLFLVGADLIALLIHLLVIPTNAWDPIETRLRSLGVLVKAIATVFGSVLTYFGLKTAFRKYLLSIDTIFDQVYFACLVGLVTLIVWAAILPIWQVELRLDPPQPMPPQVELQAKTRALIEHSAGLGADRTYTLEGLLLRPYEIKVEGAREPLVLPLITVLKGSIFHRPLLIQLPCTLEVSPIVPNSEVFLKRVGAQQEDPMGKFPDDGRLAVMPGNYEYIRVTREKDKREVREGFLMKCPTTSVDIPW